MKLWVVQGAGELQRDKQCGWLDHLILSMLVYFLWHQRGFCQPHDTQLTMSLISPAALEFAALLQQDPSKQAGVERRPVSTMPSSTVPLAHPDTSQRPCSAEQ